MVDMHSKVTPSKDATFLVGVIQKCRGQDIEAKHK